MRYYLPGLDVSKMSDEEFAKRLGCLYRIREMEGADTLTNTVKKLFSSE